MQAHETNSFNIPQEEQPREHHELPELFRSFWRALLVLLVLISIVLVVMHIYVPQ